MPQVFRFGPYWVYFWTNENKPLEPIHVHVSEGHPSANATKVWVEDIYALPRKTGQPLSKGLVLLDSNQKCKQKQKTLFPVLAIEPPDLL